MISIQEAEERGTAAAVRLREELGLRGPVTMRAAAALLTEHFSTVEVREFALEKDGDSLRGCGYILIRAGGGVLMCIPKNETAEERASTVVSLLGTLAAGLVTECGNDKAEIAARCAATGAAQEAFTAAFLGGA
jgi:hypothetical protein